MAEPAAPASTPFLELAPEEFESRLHALGGRAFHARIARREVFERGCTSYADMTSLPAALREQATRALPILVGTEQDRRVAQDGATKLLIAFGPGGDAVETVHIPSHRAERGATLCVSTQVGCPVACPFCASGKAGLKRNLAVHEILEQFVRGMALGPLSRVVVMGIGEPLLNWENLQRALAVVRGELGIGARKITVSTVGFPERLDRISAREGSPGFQLAISLHTPDDAQRDWLVPAMAGVPIEHVLAAGDRWFERTGREVTYEYVLLGGENDTSGHAERLARRLAGRRCTVNLIPFNPVGDAGARTVGDGTSNIDFRRPSGEEVRAFQDALASAGLVATVRWSRGLEAAAACGQLRLRSL